MRSSAWGRISEIGILVMLFVPAYAISVALFVFGFVIIPNGVPSPQVSYGDYNRFLHAATVTQDFVFFALIGSVLVAIAARLARVRFAIAVGIECALDAVYWITLLGIYVAGMWDGAFVVPFR